VKSLVLFCVHNKCQLKVRKNILFTIYL
jgi:hypothetical protein